MKHIKKFESFSTEGSLKERLTIHYQENESEFDPEETENVLEILGHYDDSLTGLSKWDKVFLLRLINDDNELYNEVDEIHVMDDSDINAFD